MWRAGGRSHGLPLGWLDDSRARVLAVFRPGVWCEDEVGAWLREGWERWTKDPPEWFTEEWVEGIPSHLRPLPPP